MSHYWTADDPIETRREQVVDWIEDLVEFGTAAIAAAVQTWRRTQSRRPTPADIRRLCVEAHVESREHLALTAPADGDSYARSLGYASEAERIATIRRDERRKAEQYERARLVREEIAAGVGPLRTSASASAKVLRENGVGAREYTAAELRAGRVDLGLEKPAPEAAE